jgi:hypothetical protein
MSEQRCGSCRFWGFDPPPELREHADQSGEWRTCQRLQPDNGRAAYSDEWLRRVWKHCPAKAAEVIAEPVRLELAVLWDSDGNDAVMRCRADFGCVLFEATSQEGVDTPEGK